MVNLHKHSSPVKIVLVIILTSAVQFYFRYSNFMKQKSIIIGLPVVPFKVAYYSFIMVQEVYIINVQI